MKKFLLNTSFLIILMSTVEAQQNVSRLSGEAYPIPEQSYTYMVSNTQEGWTYDWVIISGGKFANGDNKCVGCGSSETVTWDNSEFPSTISVVVKDSTNNGISLFPDLIWVTPKYLGTPTISPTHVLCNKIPTFTANNATNADVYEWTLPTGTQTIRGSNTITPSSFPRNWQGNISVTVTRDDAQGFSVTKSVNITRPLPKTPTFTQSVKSLCPNESVTFSASGVNAETYVWTTTGGIRVNGATSYEGGKSVTVSATSSGSVSVSSKSLSCQMTSSPATQEIHYGTPNVSLDAQTTSNYVHMYVKNNSTGSWINQYVNKQDITSVSWQKLASRGSCPVFLNPVPNGFMAVAEGTCQDWTMDIRVDVSNLCGTITHYKTLSAEGCTQRSYQLRQVSAQNYQVFRVITPCDQQGFRTMTQNTNSEKENGALELSVYEFNTGRLALQTTQNNLNIQRLKEGLYVVRLVIGEQLETFKIQR